MNDLNKERINNLSKEQLDSIVGTLIGIFCTGVLVGMIVGISIFVISSCSDPYTESIEYSLEEVNKAAWETEGPGGENKKGN